MNKFEEPELTIAVLDFQKPDETRICLESIKRHVKVNHKVVYYHNGQAYYAYDFFKEGLCDIFMQSHKNEGLGVGTRDLFQAITTPYTLYLQNDQFIGRDFTDEEFEQLKQYTNDLGLRGSIASVSLAGPVCGENIYSERCHIISTEFYNKMEKHLPLGCHGAGPYHDGVWREEQIQKFYKDNDFTHLTNWPPLVVDNGIYAIRDMNDGGLWAHRTDNKKLWCIRKPRSLNPAYPKFSDDEHIEAFDWPDGKIPKSELGHSFNCWDSDDENYINNLRSSPSDYNPDSNES